MKPCPHHWIPSDHDNYALCHLCGTFKSLAPAHPSDYYRKGYWSHERGHSTIREQVHNVDVHAENDWTKNSFALSLISVPDRSRVLEIGCAPGVLLGRLKQQAGFEKVVGIEVDSDYEQDIQDVSGLRNDGSALLWFGMFPKVGNLMASAAFSCILALDVFEHSLEPEAFLAECSRLLKPGGQLILMLPLVSDDLPDRMFHPAEHVYLHSRCNMAALLYAAGFGQVDFGRWCPGHETVSAWRCM